ncbi:hypothetical protein ACJMK2_040674 [Sinanodonta woodiana]|uniref:FAD dependent oxidoreductase domain-containing protein n=1 Tax=Sinanodonta woodiana TaxID=1069815 RepID=A0ABD3W3M6_SINWO
MKKQQIGVVGAGVIGLSSAILIQEVCPGSEVTIIADKFSPDTTSDVAGGFWEPHLLGNWEPHLLGNTPQERIRRWSQATWDHLAGLAHSQHASEVGACLVSGYTLSPAKLERPPHWDQVIGFREVSQEEMARFPGVKSGFFYTTVMIEVKNYLPWLMKRFKDRGGRVLQKRLSSLMELSGQYDIVVNCSGVEAQHLVNDPSIYPVRGQIIRVKAPWLKHFLIVTSENPEYVDGYILPGAQQVVLGGIEQAGDWDLQHRDADREYLWKTCTRLLPCLQNAEIVRDWTGLRPVRSAVRLEVEYLQSGDRYLTVIHNYGHGGSGVTLHWGCAKEVAEVLKREQTQGRQILSKL